MGAVDLRELFGRKIKGGPDALSAKAGELLVSSNEKYLEMCKLARTVGAKKLQENAKAEYKKFRDYVIDGDDAGICPLPGAGKKNGAEVETGEQERILAALSYVLGPVGAMVLYLLKEDDRFLRFHAIQSMLFWLSGLFLVLVLVLGIVTTALAPVVAMLCLGWIGYLMYHAERGEWEKVPLIGDFAKENC